MSAMLIKNRARKPLARDNVNAGWHPYGVGGMVTNGPCVEIRIGEYRLIIHEAVWHKLVETQNKMIADNPHLTVAQAIQGKVGVDFK